jgi:hypothetical protein
VIQITMQFDDEPCWRLIALGMLPGRAAQPLTTSLDDERFILGPERGLRHRRHGPHISGRFYLGRFSQRPGLGQEAFDTDPGAGDQRPTPGRICGLRRLRLADAQQAA